jgi:hypothetical protein
MKMTRECLNSATTKRVVTRPWPSREYPTVSHPLQLAAQAIIARTHVAYLWHPAWTV